MRMINRRPPPLLDMTPDGTIRPAPRVPLSMRVLGVAVVVAVLCTLLSVAALAIWVISLLLPVLVCAVVVAWGAFQYRRWQARRGGRPLAPQPIVVRWPPR